MSLACFRVAHADLQNQVGFVGSICVAHSIHKLKRETETHFTATGLPLQRNQSESFRFKRAAFYQGLKIKVGLAAAKAAALRINLNVQGCSIVAAPMHAPSRTSLLLPSFFHTISLSPAFTSA